ncbi:MAG: hypothetical protein KUG55_08830, partial [Cycloclasticus sp.]|nr:hypothetical protein [Cycloclasticus sp.]
MTNSSSVELQHNIEQFLYHEGSLLDDGLHNDWIGLFTDDMQYIVPIRETLDNPEQGVGGADNIPLMVDNKESMNFGLEYAYNDLVFVRGGLRNQFLKDGE